MKKATQKSSPNHRDCDKDNKDQPNQPDTGRPQKKMWVPKFQFNIS